MERDAASAMFTWTCCESIMANGSSWRRRWRGRCQNNLRRSEFPCGFPLCTSVSPVVEIFFQPQRTQRKTTGKLFFLRPQPILPVRPKEPRDPAQQQNSDDRVELMEVLAKRAPVLAKLHPKVSQRETPGPRSEESVDMKFAARHAGDSGRQRNKRADHWQQTRNEHGHVSPALKKSVSPVQFAAAHQNPASITLDQRTPAVATNFIRA